VEINYDNCHTVAQEIVKLLKGKTFTITSYYKDVGSADQWPTAILDCELFKGSGYPSQGYQYMGAGKVEIKLSQRRISWDLEEGKVEVLFSDDERVIKIRRILPGKSLIYRTITVNP